MTVTNTTHSAGSQQDGASVSIPTIGEHIAIFSVSQTLDCNAIIDHTIIRRSSERCGGQYIRKS